jgi:hypothetical protein
MRKYLLLVLVLVSFLVDHNHLATAQRTKISPLIIEINGDLVSWAATNSKQLTNWGYNSSPVLSPDGKYIAYKSLPRFVVDDIKKNGGRNGFPPSNFWVMEIATGEAFRIADQPPDAHYADANYHDEKFILRPLPAWSPDSKSLAWGEIVGNKKNPDGTWAGYDQRLVVYNLAQKSLTMLVRDMPATDGISEGDSVDWSERGLTYLVNACPCDDKTFSVLFIYSPGGKLLSQYKVHGPRPMYRALWIKDMGKDYILITTDPLSDSLLIDPDTGKESPLQGKLELYSTSTPDGIRLYYDKGWNIDDPTQSTTNIGEPLTIALSPDGKQIVYRTIDAGVLYYNAGKITGFPIKSDARIGEFVWGLTAYRIRR